MPYDGRILILSNWLMESAGQIPAKYADRLTLTTWLSGAVLAEAVHANGDAGKQTDDAIVAAFETAARKAKQRGELIVIDREPLLVDFKRPAETNYGLFARCVEAVHAVAPNVKKALIGTLPHELFPREYLVNYAQGKHLMEMPQRLHDSRRVTQYADYLVINCTQPGSNAKQAGYDYIQHVPKLVNRHFQCHKALLLISPRRDTGEAFTSEETRRIVPLLHRHDYDVLVVFPESPRDDAFMELLVGDRPPARKPFAA